MCLKWWTVYITFLILGIVQGSQQDGQPTNQDIMDKINNLSADFQAEKLLQEKRFTELQYMMINLTEEFQERFSINKQSFDILSEFNKNTSEAILELRDIVVSIDANVNNKTIETSAMLYNMTLEEHFFDVEHFQNKTFQLLANITEQNVAITKIATFVVKIEPSVTKSATSQNYCPDGFFMLPAPSNQCMKLFTQALDWDQAKAQCEAKDLVMARPTDAITLRRHLVEKHGV